MATNYQPTVRHEDTEEEVSAALEELVAAFGLRAVVAACLRNGVGESITKTGGTAAREVLQVVIREIAMAKDPQLVAEVMAVGVGVILDDKVTITRLAKKHGISKQAFSKRVVRFCEQNNLPPSIYMRSKKDRATYALTNRPRSA